MSVGKHYSKSDWDRMSYELFATYRKFCVLAEQMADDLAPLSDQAVSDRTTYTLSEVVDLKSGVNVANALRQLSQGSADASVLTMSRQVLALVGKFGGA